MNGIEIYADTSNINEIFDIYENNKLVKGFTTNPSLMKKAGIVKYIPFIKEMEYQIQKITEYGENIYVKVPITNTKSQSTVGLIEKMSNRGIKINVTAVFTKSQTDNILKKLSHIKTPSIISIFAGRIADTGINPCPLVSDVSLAIKQKNTSIKTLWASTRTVYNVYEAEQSGCDIITVTPDILPKLKLKNKNLDEFSLETVKMFYNDAKNAGYAL
jgi:transaldolase